MPAPRIPRPPTGGSPGPHRATERTPRSARPPSPAPGQRERPSCCVRPLNAWAEAERLCQGVLTVARELAGLGLLSSQREAGERGLPHARQARERERRRAAPLDHVRGDLRPRLLHERPRRPLEGAQGRALEGGGALVLAAGLLHL